MEICNPVFGLEIVMPGIFLGLKFQACVFFWVCNMKLRRTPPSCILRVPPLGFSSLSFFGKLILFRRLIKQINPACRCLLTTNLNDTRNQVHFNKVEMTRIVTSMSDMTLASVSYGKYATQVPDGVAYGIYESVV